MRFSAPPSLLRQGSAPPSPLPRRSAVSSALRRGSAVSSALRRGSALTKKSLADVAQRPARSSLVVLGIAVGVAGLCAINLSSRAIVGAQAALVSSGHTADVQVVTTGSNPALATTLRAVPNVKAVELATVYQGLWEIGSAPGQVNLQVTAYPNLAKVAVQPFELTSGHLPGPGQIVLDSTDRGYQDFSLGDTVDLRTGTGDVLLTVVGTARAMGQGSASLVGTARGYMSTAALAAISGVSKPNLALLEVTNESQAQATAQAAEAVLRKGGSTVVGTVLGSGGVARSEVRGLYLVLDTLSLAALLLAALLILNTITTLVAEQQPSMGIMKALGGTRNAVVRGYLTTVAIYAIAGTALGLIVGVLGGHWLTAVLANAIVLDTGRIPLDLGVLAISAALGLVVPLLAALGPIWWGTKVTVREALGGSRGGRELALPAWLSRVAALPRILWLGLAGAFRRPVRASLTLAALACAATTFLAIQTTSYSFNRFLDNLSGQFQADIYSQSAQPRAASALNDTLKALPNVAATEPFDESTASSSWGSVIVEATVAKPVLYKLQVVAGHWVAPGQANQILVNEELLARSGVRVGGTITLSTATHAQSWTVVGVVHDVNTGLGTAGVAVTTLDNFNAFEGLPAGSTMGLMVRTTDHSDAAVGATATKVEDALLKQSLSVSVRTAAENLQRTRDEFGVLSLLLKSVAAIVALIGILGLSSTLATSVLERRREMGTLRAMGASSQKVASVFVVEALSLAGLAVVLATALGIPLAYAFVHLIDNAVVNFGFAFNPVILLTMAVFTVGVSLLAAVLPAYGAGRLAVADCLRYE